MRKLFKLTPAQWKILSSASSNIGQAVILFSLAAFFFPEVVSLPEDFSKELAGLILISGLLLVIGAVIIVREDKK